MVTEVKILARAQDGTSKTFEYKPGGKHPGQSKTLYKLIVDGQEQLPPGTKITRHGNNVLVEFPDGQTFEITDWCGVSDSRLIDLDGAQALTAGDTASYVAAKEIESGACMIASESGQSASALGEAGSVGAGAVPAAGGGLSPGAIAGIVLGGLALAAAAGGGGGGGGGNSSGGGSAPGKPAAPDMTAATDSGSSNSDNITNATKPSFAVSVPGTGETPILFVDGVEVPATFDAATHTLTPTTALTDGNHTITTALRNASGTSPQSDPLVVTIDTVAPSPAPAVAPDMTAASDTGSSDTDDFTRTSRPSFTVPAHGAGETPVLLVDGVVVPSTFDPATNTLTPTGSLTPGIHSITTALQDVAGNTSGPSPALNITIAPVAALDPASDSGTPGDNITNDTTPSIQGFGTPGDTVTVTFPGGEVKTVTITNPDGSWQVTPSLPLTPDGVKVITIVATDPLGNISSSSSLSVTIDTTAPSKPSIVDIPENTNNGSIGAAEAADGTTVQVGIPANAQAGDTLTLNIGGQPVSYTVLAADIGGTVNVPVSAAVLAGLGDGVIPVSATLTDAAGNVSAPSAASSLNLDRASPSTPSITAVPENNNGSVNQAEASDGTIIQVSIPADAKAGDTLTLNVGGQSVSYTVLAGDIGATANVLVGAPVLAALSDGTIPVTATLTDQAGNVGTTSAPFNFTLDRGTPAAPTALDLTPGSDSGSSNTDDNTSDTTPTITGAPVEPGATVTLYDSDGTTVLGTTVADALGNWNITSSPLTDGVHNFTTKQTDQAGNQGPASTPLPVTIDTTAPSAPIAPDMEASSDSGISNTDNITNVTSPDFDVAIPAGHTATLYVDGVAVPSTLVAGVLTPTGLIPDGPRNITYTVTDLAGNESAQSPGLAIVIDSTPPSAPIINRIPENSGGGVTFNPGPPPTGEQADGTTVVVDIPPDAKPGDVLQIHNVGDLLPIGTHTIVAGENGTSVNVTIAKADLDALGNDGVHPLVATLIDLAGNVSAPSSAFPLVLTNAALTSPIISAIPENNGGGINAEEASHPNIIVTVDVTGSSSGAGAVAVGDILRVTIDGVTFDITLNEPPLTPPGTPPSGPYSVFFTAAQLPALDGDYLATAVIISKVGGLAGTESPPFPLTLDRTAPATPAGAPDMTPATDTGISNSDDTTADNTPSFTINPPGTGETPSLYVDGAKVAATFDAVTHTLTPTNPIADGTHSITYTLTDAVGNVSGAF